MFGNKMFTTVDNSNYLVKSQSTNNILEKLRNRQK